MQLTVIKKNRLNIFTLPDIVSGNHWITDFENGRKINLLNIEEENGLYKLISNDDAYVVDNNGNMIPYIFLKEYSFYLINNNYRNEKNYLYCSPSKDESYKEFGIKADGNAIKVGFSDECDISYKLSGIPEEAFTIGKESSGYYVNITNNNASVYVNQKRVIRKKKIEYGDIVFIFGLKIILMRRDGSDYLLVNNPANLIKYSANYVNVVKSKDEFVDDNKEITDDSLYQERSFFYRTPHFYKKIDKLIVNVDAPPSKKEEDQTPAILTVGPMITMSMVSVVMVINVISNAKDAGKLPILQLIMPAAMLASSLLWPTLTRKYQKHVARKEERKRQNLYKKYIDGLENKINDEMINQRNILQSNHYTVAGCQSIIKSHDTKLWQRRLNDNDFLMLPVGYGSIKMDIQVNYPEEHFSMVEDNLLDAVHALGEKERIIENVPIVYPFYENTATGIVGDAIVNKAFIDRLVLQIMTNYSYDEVKLVTLTSTDNKNDWDYIKALPHSYTNDKSFRFFGSDNEDYREIMYMLEKEYHLRKESNNSIKHIPHYVIITDAIKSIDNYDFLKEIMSSEIKYGFSIIMLVDKLAALPNECKNFIEVSPNECSIFNSNMSGDRQKFTIDNTSIEDIYDCAKELSNILVDIKSDVQLSLPDTYHFLEMYQVGKVEQLSCLERWKKSNPVLSLQAPIGIGKNGEVIALDLHEKYHGPHGLIAGTTGSGKSEFIISYILSLAVNYHPDEVELILIDYKGGSLTGAFSNGKYELPHLAGTITNLDGGELNRSLASIESEVKRRQREFNEAKNISGESTMDIYKFQKLYREGRLKGMEPIAHLFIISDEFAELKEQQPEFMDDLISIARVGRSLGIHLILATQKPGGVVNAQIWSNTRFRVCLKVQDTGDSQEVLKKPDAAYLKQIGRFYLQVGYDEVYTLGQSAWSGGQYYPSSTFRKDVDTSINVINNIGYVTTTKDNDVSAQREAMGEELSNIVKYICELGKTNNIKAKKLWLPKISERIYIDDLKVKYSYAKEDFYINPVIGEYDDPDNQMQEVLTIPFSKHGNSIVFGSTGSGKENFIRSLIYSLSNTYTPDEVNMYILDFGSETLKMFESSPYVGDVIYVDEVDRVNKLFKMIEKEVEERKKKFSNYGGSYNSYVQSGGREYPSLLIVINNMESFVENYEDLQEEFIQIIRDSFKYGVHFLITANSESAVRNKIRQSASLVYVLRQNDDSDYVSLLGSARGMTPSKFKGRGLFKKDKVFEFQTAYITDEDNENEFIKNNISELSQKYTSRAKKVPVLPDIVNYDFVKDAFNNNTEIPVGVNKTSLQIEKYNMAKNSINIVASTEIENTYNFAKNFIKELVYADSYKSVQVVNTTPTLFKINGVPEITKNYDDVITKLYDYVEKCYKQYEESKFNDELLVKCERVCIVIYGVQDFMNKLSSDSQTHLVDLIKHSNQMGLVSLVLIDNADAVRAYAYEEWFKSGADTSRGIWIGNGIVDQSLFRINKMAKEDREEITNDYGFVISSGRLYLMKVIKDFSAN